MDKAKLRERFAEANQTTVGKTTIGSAIAVILVSLLSRFVIDLGAETGASLVGGFTIIFNYFIPAKKKQG